ncbi:hypothetical protein [Salinarimonas sp.]|uniref:hypothetical protein n=1 Tax=Salinarimonas sp. TaxID=2766526 RepID=UPI0032D9A34A
MTDWIAPPVETLAPGLVRVATPRGPFTLAETDAQVIEAASRNARAGFFNPQADPAALCDKSLQHALVRKVEPDLAFEAVDQARAEDVPSAPERTLVVRPRLSASSKGSALVIGPDRPPSPAERAYLARCGALHAHVHEPGQPIFVNGVVSGGRLALADVWRCILMPIGCRDILASVVNLPRAALPADLTERLGRLARALGILAGPVHFELVLTQAGGARLVKAAPRLATEPLPALCRLGGQPGQRALFERARAHGFETALPDTPEPEGFVADYSFVVDEEGVLLDLPDLPEIRRLPTYRYLYQEPALGARAAPTFDGYSYGATVFLAHAALEVLEADIARLDAINRRGAFVVGPVADDLVPLAEAAR